MTERTQPPLEAPAIPPELIAELIKTLAPFVGQLLLALFAGLITGGGGKPPGPPTPVIPPGPPTPLPPPVVPPPVVSGPKRRIVGGRGAIQSATVNGPTGPRIPDAECALIVAGNKPAPNDTRFYIDITPRDQDGQDFVGGDNSWNIDPQPPSPASIYPIALHFSWVGDGEADLSHEYANFGCDPRVRCIVPQGGHGQLRDVYALGPDYGDGTPPARIDIAAGPIHVGE